MILNSIKKKLKKSSFVYSNYKKLKIKIKIIKWFLQGKQNPPPHEIKARIVKSYAKKFGIKTLIETGTYYGQMITSCIKAFDYIYSIELDNKLYHISKNKFKKYSHVTILKGDSAQILPELLSSIKKPCLFWLDAHYSGGVTAKGDKETPIIEEMKSILKHSISDHVILIDDARAFLKEGNYRGAENYPNVERLLRLIKEKNNDYSLEIETDVIRITKN